jgi:hypothetical protein
MLYINVFCAQICKTKETRKIRAAKTATDKLRAKQSLKRQLPDSLVAGGETPEIVVVEPDIRPHRDQPEVIRSTKKSTERVTVAGKTVNDNRPHSVDIHHSTEG